MTAFFCRLGKHIRWRLHKLHGLLSPRAIAWRFIKKRHPDKVIITKLGNDLKVRIHSYDVIGKDIYIYGMFEKAECQFVRKFLKEGMIFFDIGANLGQYTLIGANCVGAKGKVHSFEPSSRMFSELENNVSLNRFSNICTLNNVAVSDKQATAKLSKYEKGNEVYGSLGNQNRSIKSSHLSYEEVRTITLDGYIEEHQISHVDLIKIDIEGAELLAIRGAMRLLSKPEAPTIVLEMADVNTDGFGYKAIKIWDYLSTLGYTMHYFDKKGNIGLAKRPADFAKGQNLLAIKL